MQINGNLTRSYKALVVTVLNFAIGNILLSTSGLGEVTSRKLW